MALIVKKPWTNQPQIPVGIDWGNPTTRDLVSALDATTGTDRVTGKLLTLVSNPSKAPGVKGVGYVGNNASLGYVTIPLTLGARLTFVLVSSSVVRTANGDILMGLGASGGNQVACFQSGSGASNRFVFRQTNGGGASTRNYGTNASVSAVPAVLVSTIINSSAVDSRVFWNGVLDQGSVVDGSSGANTTYDTFALGGVKRAADTYADTGNNGALALLFNRVLTDSEIKSLSDNPWQIFAPLRRTLWDGGPVVVTIARPGSDITTTGWTGTPDNVTKYANIDESSASDADYITSPQITGVVAPITFGIKDQNGNPNTLPVGTWDVNVRANFTEGTTAPTFRIALLDSGGVSVGNSAYQLATASYATYTLPVTTTGIAAQIRIEFP